MSTVTLINSSEVPPGQDERFLWLWNQADELLRSRGGFRSTRLHGALGPGARSRYVDVAELRTVDTWQSIVSSPEFGALAARMGQFHPSPGRCTVETARTLPSAEPV